MSDQQVAELERENASLREELDASDKRHAGEIAALRVALAAKDAESEEISRERDACITAVQLVADGGARAELIHGRIGEHLRKLQQRAEAAEALAAEKQSRAEETERVAKRCAEIAQTELLRAWDIYEGRRKRAGNLKQDDAFTDGWRDGAGQVQALIQIEFQVQADPVIDAMFSTGSAAKEPE